MKFPGVVAVLCVVPSGLVLHIGITSCTFPPWTEMSKKYEYELSAVRRMTILQARRISLENNHLSDCEYFTSTVSHFA